MDVIILLIHVLIPDDQFTDAYIRHSTSMSELLVKMGLFRQFTIVYTPPSV